MTTEHKFRQGGGGGPGLQPVLSLCPYCCGRQTGGGGGVGKPDPLVEIAEAWGLHNTVAKSWVKDLRAALDKLGFEIREKNDD